MSQLRHQNPTPQRRQGFTLVEAMVSLGVFSVLVLFVCSIATEITVFSGNSDASYAMHNEVDRSFNRLSEILRKTGWSIAGGVEYPRVAGGGSQLEFRALADLDGNGYAFDATNGEVEWGAPVFTVRRDPATSILAIYNGATQVWVLGRYISAVQFATYKEVSSLHLKEVRVTLTAQRLDHQGNQLASTTTGSIHMRN